MIFYLHNKIYFMHVFLFKKDSSCHLQAPTVACIFFFLVRSFFFVASTKKKNEQRKLYIQYNTEG